MKDLKLQNSWMKTWEKINDIGLDKDFWDMTLKGQAPKRKIGE